MAGGGRHRAGWACLLLLLLLLVGCGGLASLVGRPAEPVGPLGRPFSHAAHAESLECADCHAGATAEARAGYPPVAFCLECHAEGVGEAVQPFEATLAGLSDPVAWPTRNRLPDIVRFSHAGHAEAEVACGACHGDVGASQRVLASAVRVGQDRCAGCHEAVRREDGPAAVADGRCERCHVAGIGATRKPAYHDGSWIGTHGLHAEAFRPPHGLDCEACHETPGDCVRCHAATRPASHTAYWTERGHGLPAQLARESCAVCHREDSCRRCHDTVRPRSHRGTWGRGRQEHCNNCHLGQDGAFGCAACHEAAVHATADLQPVDAWHATATDSLCTQCHRDLPHPDPGQGCVACHR